jgi:hypothetical protein
MEDVVIYRGALTRIRRAQLEALKRQNSILRATLALMEFYQVYNCHPMIGRSQLSAPTTQL